MKKFFVCLAAALGILLSQGSARAAYAVQVYDDGNLEFQSGSGVASIGAGGSFILGNSLIYNSNTTHFSITNGSALSNNPGTPVSANLDLSTNEQITTVFGVNGGTHTLKIVLSQTGFTAPAGSPLNLSSSMNGSFVGTVTGNSVSANYQGSLDPTNALFGTPASGTTSPLTGTIVTVAPAVSQPLILLPGTSSKLVPGGTPFSMMDVVSLTFFANPGSGQDTANVSGSTVATVPAPAGLVLILSGLPCVGIGTWLRRRQVRLAVI